MIYVDRSTVEIPEILESDAVADAYRELKLFYANKKLSKQKKGPFKNGIANHLSVLNQLMKLFNSKCAYCERKLDIETARVDNFRPMYNSRDLRGSVFTQHYWWLAYDWSNIFLSCKQCKLSSAGYFPLEHKSKRANVNGSVEKEKHLLIDPCKKLDFRKSHISFENEEAVPLTPRGEVTINIFRLNRHELLAERGNHLESFRKKLNELKRSLSTTEIMNSLESFQLFFENDSPFISCIWANNKNDLSAGGFIKNFKTTHDRVGLKKTKSASLEFKRKNEKAEEYSIDDIDYLRKQYALDRPMINKISIKNFKIIRELELEFGHDKDLKNIDDIDLAPWIVMLGENGSGKSSILQAVSLALAGQNRLNEIVSEGLINAKEIINRNAPKGDDGWVKIYMENLRKPIVLSFDRTSETFKVTPKEPKLIVRAYGSTRLLNDKQKSPIVDPISIQNLFDPFSSLQNVQQWISDPKKVNKKRFNLIAGGLAKLFGLEDDKYFIRTATETGKQQVELVTGEAKKGEPIDSLSDGYKSMIALVLDIMLGFLPTEGWMDSAKGLVIIDEIGVHLHPRWKMNVVGKLREIFPNLNFLVSTHEPLCLKGLGEGEVKIIRNDAEGLRILSDLPDPSKFRVDQLLTSPFFGLNSIVDDEQEKAFAEYYQLLTKEEVDGLTSSQQKRLDRLTVELSKYNVMGNSLREELAYYAVDKLLAEKKDEEMKLDELKEITFQKVKDLWNEYIKE